MRLVLAAVLPMAVLAGCAGGAPTGSPPTARPHTAGAVEVRLTCATGDADTPCAFVPPEVTIRIGGAVRWVNDDATYHTVTSSDRLDVRVPNGGFDAVLDAPREAFTHTFATAGSYPYYCQPHAEFMAGTVRVTDE